jgi:hypothetical protein
MGYERSYPTTLRSIEVRKYKFCTPPIIRHHQNCHHNDDNRCTCPVYTNLINQVQILHPNMLTRNAIDITHQNINTVCQAFATKSSFHSVMADKINCAPEKLILRVTVQLPTSVSHPVIHDTIGAHSLVLSMADQ